MRDTFLPIEDHNGDGYGNSEQTVGNREERRAVKMRGNLNYFNITSTIIVMVVSRAKVYNINQKISPLASSGGEDGVGKKTMRSKSKKRTSTVGHIESSNPPPVISVSDSSYDTCHSTLLLSPYPGNNVIIVEILQSVWLGLF